MSVLGGLKPKKVFEFFEEICSIPHGSGNTKQISDWLVAFAKERGLEHYQDEINNVIIKKNGTAGYENSAPVILQGHMDMVCEKAPDCALDMEKEGLILKTDGEVVFAEGTTLGGDDGIALAMALAVLDSNDIPHPPVEAVFTVDEEVGLIGAAGIDVSPLSGKRLINIDSEEEGIFTVSCAGGARVSCTLPIKREEFFGKAFSITVGGLLGGHSGVEIDKGRANSNVLMGRVLELIAGKTKIRIISASGGLKENAIPRQSEAVICAEDETVIKEACELMEKIFKNEYALTDAEIYIKVNEAQGKAPMDKESTERLICMLSCMPNGVMEMSAGIKGLVQTSLNIGTLETFDNEIIANVSTRSSIDSQKEMLYRKIKCLMEGIGGTAEEFESYTGWEYKKESPLRDLMTEVYREQYGKEPLIQAIHAGLECGVFAGKIAELDCISIGPDMSEIHTFSETLYVKSTERVYNMILETLKRMK